MRYSTKRSANAHVHDVTRLALPLRDARDLDPLVARVGDARFVLLGEASHGTHEYYTWRSRLTERLIREKGFSFVAVEGDWPDCYRIDRWVRGHDDHHSARDVLRSFDRWPTWMWSNEEIVELITWLRDHNLNRSPNERAAFYGLDVYSLWDSLRAVIGYLERHEPDAVEAARQAWRCFDPYGEDPQEYARATRLIPLSCENDVVTLLTQMRHDAVVSGDDAEARFDAQQNATLVAGAERYYRAMVRGGPDSWNIRDTHMADTLDRLIAHHGRGSKAIVWEHNTHIGDARATDMSASGMVNVGQLVRERHAHDGVVLVGFGSYEGQVIAARAWGAPGEEMDVPPAASGSHEDLMHRARVGDALFVFPGEPNGWLGATLPHRAIGVVYHPEFERAGNYVATRLGRRYDAFCYLARTRGLHPLERERTHDEAELQTFPSGR